MTNNQSHQPEWLMYKAEIFNPEEPEYPELTVFHENDDTSAIEYASDLCINGLKLLEVHQLDENYDSIRMLDLGDKAYVVQATESTQKPRKPNRSTER